MQRELKKSTLCKKPEWSRGIAVGSEDYVSSIQNSFGKKTEKRKIKNKDSLSTSLATNLSMKLLFIFLFPSQT